MDLNAQVRDVITPPENRKKRSDHFDQYRMINNNESFRQHVSNNLFRDDDAIKATISMPLTEEGNKICPTHILNPKACFNNTINHLFRDGTRKNIIPVLFPSSQPDPKGFMAENYLNGNKFIVAEDQRKHMIELTSRDLNPENFMKVQAGRLAALHSAEAIVERHAEACEADRVVRDVTYNVDEISSKLDEWNIDITKNYQFNGHGYKDIWADNENHCEGRATRGRGQPRRHARPDDHAPRGGAALQRRDEDREQRDAALPRVHEVFQEILAIVFASHRPRGHRRQCDLLADQLPERAAGPELQHDDRASMEVYGIDDAILRPFPEQDGREPRYVRFVATQHFKIIQMWLGSGFEILDPRKDALHLQGPGQRSRTR